MVNAPSQIQTERLANEKLICIPPIYADTLAYETSDGIRVSVMGAGKYYLRWSSGELNTGIFVKPEELLWGLAVLRSGELT